MPVTGVTPDVVDDHYYKRMPGMFEEAKHVTVQVGYRR